MNTTEVVVMGVAVALAASVTAILTVVITANDRGDINSTKVAKVV